MIRNVSVLVVSLTILLFVFHKESSAVDFISMSTWPKYVQKHNEFH